MVKSVRSWHAPLRKPRRLRAASVRRPPKRTSVPRPLDVPGHSASDEHPVLQAALWRGNREAEPRSFARRRFFEPDAAAVLLDDAPADREAHAAALVGIPAVQALEDAEDVIRVFAIDADAVIGYRDHPCTVSFLSPDVNLRGLPAI